ncbi:MAG: AAA family ATPase, partial [Polyangiales bacterium]
MRQGERLALIEGPSGAGKSRLLAEFRSRVRLQGGVVLEGRCEPGRAFGPFAEIVDRALRFLDEVGASPSIDLADLACRESCHRFWYQHGSAQDAPDIDIAQQTANATAEALEALERRLRFFDAIEGLLRDVAAVRPPVVMLHDLERADRGTLQLLQCALDGSGPWGDGVAPERTLHALFVTSVRSDAQTVDDHAVGALRAHDSAVVLPVSSLDEEGVRAYLQSPEAVARVLRRTGGLPESIDLLLEADPLTPETHLARQLRQLDPVARALVEALAVLEHPSDVELLARVADVAPSKDARQAFGESELVARSIVDGCILFSFARESCRERAYELLDGARRRELHARCAELFEATPGKSREAAHHALRAGDLERAVPLAIEAARSLAARHAHAEAATLLERVLEEAPGELPTDVEEYLADLYRVAGDYPSALAHAER